MTDTLGLRVRIDPDARFEYSKSLALATSVISLLLLAAFAVEPTAATVVAGGGSGEPPVENVSDAATVKNGSGEITVKERGRKEAGQTRRGSGIDDSAGELSSDRTVTSARGIHRSSVDGRLPSDTAGGLVRDLSTQQRQHRALDARVTVIRLEGASDRTMPLFSPAKRTEAWDEQAAPVERVTQGSSRLVLASRWQALLFASVLMNVVLGSVVVFRRVGANAATRLAGPLEPITPGTEGTDAPDTPESRAGSEPVSDEEIVHRLLEENDGQMRQSEIVDEQDWSKAKVSRILCEMAASDEIVKIQIGRENLICLEGEQPEIAKPMS